MGDGFYAADLGAVQEQGVHFDGGSGMRCKAPATASKNVQLIPGPSHPHIGDKIWVNSKPGK